MEAAEERVLYSGHPQAAPAHSLSHQGISTASQVINTWSLAPHMVGEKGSV